VKIRIQITDESGRFYAGEVELFPTANPKRSKRAEPVSTIESDHAVPRIDFGVPLRPFLKAHSKGKTGTAKFVLLLAHLAKGKTGMPIQKADLEKAWNRVTTHLGRFNPAFTTRAKDRNWVDSPKMGEYVLLPSWVGALTD
jgi:hypothetical protein